MLLQFRIKYVLVAVLTAGLLNQCTSPDKVKPTITPTQQVVSNGQNNTIPGMGLATSGITNFRELVAAYASYIQPFPSNQTPSKYGIWDYDACYLLVDGLGNSTEIYVFNDPRDVSDARTTCDLKLHVNQLDVNGVKKLEYCCYGDGSDCGIGDGGASMTLCVPIPA